MSIDSYNDDYVPITTNSMSANQQSLKSSFLTPTRRNKTKKRVRVVSAVKWNTTKSCSSERQRNFIKTALSPEDIKRLSGEDGEVGVNKLLVSNWTPEPHHIDAYNKKAAKFVQNEDERVIYLECADFDYLAKFEKKELEKWAGASILLSAAHFSNSFFSNFAK